MFCGLYGQGSNPGTPVNVQDDEDDESVYGGRFNLSQSIRQNKRPRLNKERPVGDVSAKSDKTDVLAQATEREKLMYYQLVAKALAEANHDTWA